MTTKIGERPRGRTVKARNPVRLTALLYLKEALLKENYEDCAQMIDIALEFGATQNEVLYLLEDPRRNPAG